MSEQLEDEEEQGQSDLGAREVPSSLPPLSGTTGHCSSSTDLAQLTQVKDCPHNLPEKAEPPMSRIGLDDHKAGMEGLDKNRINKVILEATKGSKFYQNELRKDREIKKRIDQMVHKLAQTTKAQREEALRSADREVALMERSRELGRVIVHVDMDAFYAAVEMRDNPSLRDVPMAVGSNNMLSTSNYVSRRYGVRAAMPGFIAKKLCPELIIVPLTFSKYEAVSGEVRQVLKGYDPTFCPVGLDEAYLDITDRAKSRLLQEQAGDGAADEADMHRSQGSLCVKDEELFPSVWKMAERIVQELRTAIVKKTALTASAGIAPNKMLAKVASDRNKPNGQYLVEPTREGVLAFMHNLPIRKVCGIGKVTEKMLNALEVNVCRDLYEKRDTLHLAFSQSSANFFTAVSLGLGSVQVQRSGDRKGIGTERSFPVSSDPDQLKKKCSELCEHLAQEMQEDNISGYTITLKVKTVEFLVRSRAVTLPHPVSKSEDIFHSAKLLLEEEIRSCHPHPLNLRLMGVRVTSLTSKRFKNHQQSLVTFLKPVRDSSIDTAITSTQRGKGQSSASGCCIPGSDESAVTETSLRSYSSSQGSISEIVCPVCAESVLADNTGINHHIDQCLNLAAFKDTNV